MPKQKLEKKRTKTVIVKHAYPVLRGAVNNHCFYQIFFREMPGHFPKINLEIVADFPAKVGAFRWFCANRFLPCQNSLQREKPITKPNLPQSGDSPGRGRCPRTPQAFIV